MQYYWIKQITKSFDRVSLRWALGTLAASFLAATVASIVCAFLIEPIGGKVSKGPPSEAKQASPISTNQVVTLTADQARKIIDRNIFSSDGNATEGAEGGQSGDEKNKSNRAVESKLPIALRGVIFGGDPLNGLALIENTEKHTINSFVASDIILPKAKLLEIYPEHIILDNDGRHEYKKLDVKPPEKSRRGKKKTPGIETETPGIAPIATGPVPENFKEPGFERAGHNIQVSEDYKRSLLGPQMTKVLQDAKAEPNMVGGQLKGFRMTRIREESIYQKAGLMNGDVVHEINGVPLNDASGAIRLLNQLRNEKEIEVRIERGGSFFNVTLSIQ